MLAVLCLAVVVASLAGGWLPLASVLTHTRLQAYLSFSAGAMLGAAFFHMMPEAVAVASPSALHWTAGGLLAIFFLERFFAYHHHESDGHADGHDHDHGPHEHEGSKSRSLHWGAAAIGLAIHSLTGGVALASAWQGDENHGAAWGVFLATVIHKPADALTITSLMIRAGLPARLAHLVNLGFALMIPLGAALFFVGLSGLAPQAAEMVSARVLAFSAGTFLCIALSDLLPELQLHNHDRLLLSGSLLAGFGLMGVTDIWASGHFH